jgi:outer membrane protein TolC
LLGGCSVKTGLAPAAIPPPPAKFHQSGLVDDYVDERWWEAFGDPTLNRLMTEVFNRNLSLQAALARLDQFAAVSRIEDSSRYPQIDAGADGSLNVGSSAGCNFCLRGPSEAARLPSPNEAALFVVTGRDYTLTTFYGLMPIVLEKSFHAQFLVPLAVSLAFGVLASA